MNKSFNFQRFIFIIMAFCAGASVMIVELAANRILSPLFGNSLFTWTALIGVILVSMSLGNYLGGKLVDKFPNRKLLKTLLFTAGLSTVMIPGLQNQINQAYINPNIIWGPISACLILFSIPGILLGSITPVVIRLVSLTSNDSKIGFSVGSISAASTLGSVVGTFVTGFVLIPLVGIKSIYFSCGSVLISLSIVIILMDYMEKKRLKKAKTISIIFLTFLAFILSDLMSHQVKDSSLLLEDNTFYHRIRIKTSASEDKKDTILSLFLDSQFEGAQFEKSKELPMLCQKYWKLSKIFNTKVDNALFIGGGAFGMPIALSDYNKDAKVDVVELDPELIKLGKKYFKLETSSKVKPIAGDGRVFFHSNKKKYDLIFGDAFHGLANIPAHLVTKEFFSLVNDSLTDNGIFMMNIISSIQGESALFDSIRKTVNTVFKNVYIFTPQGDLLYGRMNIILVASNKDIDFKSNALKYLEDKELQIMVQTFIPSSVYKVDEGQLLTDDHNPAEYLIAKALLYNEASY
ncbi:MAG: fused MFS/spermidine synthase [bacterium]